MTKTNQAKLFANIFREAHLMGTFAGEHAAVMPMVVNEHAQVGNDRSPITKQYFVEGGVCGFAWVSVRPANSPFANWCKKNGKGRTSEYEGGLTIRVSEFGQSLQRKEAYASAFAEVLNKYDINAYSNSRID